MIRQKQVFKSSLDVEQPPAQGQLPQQARQCPVLAGRCSSLRKGSTPEAEGIPREIWSSQFQGLPRRSHGRSNNSNHVTSSRRNLAPGSVENKKNPRLTRQTPAIARDSKEENETGAAGLEAVTHRDRGGSSARQQQVRNWKRGFSCRRARAPPPQPQEVRLEEGTARGPGLGSTDRP